MKNKEELQAINEITIKEVITSSDLRLFVELPYKLHKDLKNWCPPLYGNDKETFNPEKNFSFKHCDTIRLLAFKNNEIVGRVMGIIHHEYNKSKNENNARFAFFDSIEDEAVFKELIHKIEEWALSKGCVNIVGPLGFSDKDPQGFVIEGFEEHAVLLTNYNTPFFPSMMDTLGFLPEVILVQYKFPVSEEYHRRMEIYSKRVTQNGSFTLKNFSNTKSIKPYVSSVFDLINEAYKHIYGFAFITDAEVKAFADNFLSLLNPAFVKMVFDKENKLAGFMVGMPDIALGIKKADGKLFPFGWWHILRSLKKSKDLVLLLGAVREEYRARGIDAVMGESFLRSAIELGYKTIDSHLIMETNFKMRAEYERIEGAKRYKRYCIYKKAL